MKSYDLVAVKPFIISCDIAKLPLENNSVDAAVFCLSLMGLNYLDFLTEAAAKIKINGYLMISEVSSRLLDKKGFIKYLSIFN